MSDVLNDDVEYLISSLSDHSDTNQLVTSYEGKICKIENLNYYPDSGGRVIFKRLTSPLVGGYSVANMVEFLKKYGGSISDVKFESHDGTIHQLLNVYESDLYTGIGSYTSVLSIGVPGGVLKMDGKVSSENRWIDTGVLYPELQKGFNSRW